MTALGATARHHAGVEPPRSHVGWPHAPPDLNSTEQLRENIRVLLNLLQSNTAWLSRDSVIQHSRSGRRSPWTPSASSWGAPPYVPWAVGTEFTHSRFIIYLFVYLFITQACMLVKTVTSQEESLERSPGSGFDLRAYVQHVWVTFRCCFRGVSVGTEGPRTQTGAKLELSGIKRL